MHKAGHEGRQASEKNYRGMMFIVIFITAANKKEAGKISEGLIKKRLAACVNTLGGIKSLFRWKGKIDEAKEVLLMVKSKKTNFQKIAGFVKSVHSYQVPEIIAIPIIAGNKPYLEWINAAVR
jgi:periplasmic divalent cation tolerance protein